MGSFVFERPRALYSLHRSCPPMAVAVALNLRPSACHRMSSKLFAAVKPALPVPRFRQFERSSPCWKWAGEEWTPPVHDLIEMGSFPVISFVCAYVPGTTRWHAPAASTALLKRHPAFGFMPETIGSRLRLVLLETLSSEWAVESPGYKPGTGLPLRPPHSLPG